MSTARQGRDVEHAARKALDDAGYWTIRSAASKGRADIVAIKTRQILLVQCKRAGSLPPAEHNALWQLAARFRTDLDVPVLAVLARRGKPVTAIEFWELTSTKIVTGAKSPMVPLVLDEAAEVTR